MYDQSGTPGGRFHFDGALIAGAQETDNDVQIIRPHLCDHVDVSADFREFTFHIREGLKWTDGVNLTADDVLWWQHSAIRLFFPRGREPSRWEMISRNSANSVPGPSASPSLPRSVLA